MGRQCLSTSSTINYPVPKPSPARKQTPSVMPRSSGLLFILTMMDALYIGNSCTDRHVWCGDWSRRGECTRNPDYMLAQCPSSCGRCTSRSSACVDRNPRCVEWQQKGECAGNPAYMLPNCARSCGQCGAHGTLSTNRPMTTTESRTHSCTNVRRIPSTVRSQFRIPSFHQRYTEAYGIPVVSSAAVPDRALTRACYITRFLFADRVDVRNGYLRNRGYIAVIGKNEGVLSLPEYAFLRGDRSTNWNNRARGFGANKAVPVSSIGEENLLCYGYPADRYPSQDIGIHEFAHGLHLLGATDAIPGFDGRLQAAYRSAVSRGLWRSTYAGQDHKEYFAEGVATYFNVNRCTATGQPDGVQNHICTRSALYSYDPTLYALIKEVFPCDNRLVDRCTSQAAANSQQLKTHVNGECVTMT